MPSVATASNVRWCPGLLTSDISRSRGVFSSAVVRIDRPPASPRRPRSAECGPMQRLEFRFLGFPEFRLNGRRVELALREAAALLIYLAEAGGPVAREVAV